jgi:hypothetical protein
MRLVGSAGTRLLIGLRNRAEQTGDGSLVECSADTEFNCRKEQT